MTGRPRPVPITWFAGVLAVVGAALMWAAGPSLAGAVTSGTPTAELVGTLRLAPSACPSGRPAGSWVAVTFGTKIIGNRDSTCDDGAYTLLPPGNAGLSTTGYTPVREVGFADNGTPLATAITKPVEFDGQPLGIVSDSRDLQDAPSGPSTFAPARVYLVGHDQLVADMRSIQALYAGPHGESCVQATGDGCWLIGSDDATGTYNPTTHRFELSWYTGQSFSTTSAGTDVHLAGVFHGAVRPVGQGRDIDLGTQSFVAGPPGSIGQVNDAADRSDGKHADRPRTGPRNASRSNGAGAPGRRTTASSLRPTDASGGKQVGSPTAFVIGELLVLLNVLALLAVGLRRRSR